MKTTIRDEATEINKAVEAVKKEANPDAVILTIHEGERDDANAIPLTKVVNKLKGVDAVFGGHSHWQKDMEVKDSEGKTRPVVIAKCTGQGYVDLKMTVKADKTLSFSPAGSNYKNLLSAKDVDPEAKAIVDAAVKEVAPKFAVEIGSTPKGLNRNFKGDYGDSELGNWACEVTKTAVKADISIQNNGGIRADIPAGKITVGSMFNIMPFDNELVTAELTGAQFKTLLEQSVADTDKGRASGVQIAGAKFEYDLTQPSMKRITKVAKSDGSEIKDNEKIVLATSDFLSTGTASNLFVFADKDIQASIKKTNFLLRDVFAKAVEDAKVIEGSVDGRIKEGKATQNADKNIQILATSDLHNRMVSWDYATDSANNAGSLAKVATKVKELRNANPNTILIDGGDSVQDNSASLFIDQSKYDVDPIVQGMKKLGYDSWTLGNHEFNYGMDKVKDFVQDFEKDSKAKVLCGNVYDKDGKRIAAPYQIIERDGIKIGVIGITTPNITEWDSANLKDCNVTGAVKEAQAAIKELTGKVDMMMGVFHMGEQNEYGKEDTGVIEVASKLPELSVIVAAHMHITIDNHYAYNGKAYGMLKDAKTGKVTSYIALDKDVNQTVVTEKEYNEAKANGIMIVENGKFAKVK